VYCNGLPERNVGFIPYVKEIIRMLDNERLAISPQLNLKLGESEIKTVKVGNKKEIDHCKKKAVLHHKLSSCPQCGIGDLWAVCTVKNFETNDYSPECDYCGHVESK